MDRNSILSVDDIKLIGEAIADYYPLTQINADFHKSQAFIRWLFGGNQSSKSHTNMMDLAMLVCNVHPFRRRAGGVHWCCIESWEQARDLLWEAKLKQFIPRRRILNIAYGQDKVPRRVSLVGDHTIVFKAFNQGRTLFEGHQIDTCYCDEQCKHDFGGILQEIQARLMAKNGSLSWSMTPIIPQPILEERIESLPDTDEVFCCDLNDNRKSRGGYIEDKRIDNMIDDWPEETQETRIKGKFASFFGCVYKHFNRVTHVVKPFAIPDSWERFGAVDFGFTNPFVFLWLARDRDKNWYVYKEYYESKMTIGEHIIRLKPMLERKALKAIYADPENAGDRATMRKAGIPTKTARNAVARGIEIVQSKLKVKGDGKPSLYIFNNCKQTCREIASYHYPKSSRTRNAKDLPEAVNDHAVSALRYGIYSAEKPKKLSKANAA